MMTDFRPAVPENGTYPQLRNHAPPTFLVSAMMPLRNEARCIARSLGSVLRQDYPAELVEVLVVEDIFAEDTSELVQQRTIR